VAFNYSVQQTIAWQGPLLCTELTGVETL